MTVENQNQSNHKANQGRERNHVQPITTASKIKRNSSVWFWFYETNQGAEQTQTCVYLRLLANEISSCHRLTNQIQVWRESLREGLKKGRVDHEDGG